MQATTTGSDHKTVRPIKVTAPPKSPSDEYYVRVDGEYGPDIDRFWEYLGLSDDVVRILRNGGAVRMLLAGHDWYELIMAIYLNDLPISVLSVESEYASRHP